MTRYADLASVIDACKPPLNQNNIFIVQATEPEPGTDYIDTALVHVSGEWIGCRTRLAVSKPNDSQSMGSAISYARRYALMALCCMQSEDDDGNASSGNGGANSKAAPKQQGRAAASQPRNAGNQSGSGFAELSEGMDSSWTGLLQDAKIINSKPDAAKKWSMVAAKLSDGKEACTFDKGLMAQAQELIGTPVVLSVKPGRIEGKFELVGIIPATPPQSRVRPQDGGLRNDEISAADMAMANNTF
jgi:hypothetical protein